jgi:hypothetical protein
MLAEQACQPADAVERFRLRDLGPEGFDHSKPPQTQPAGQVFDSSQAAASGIELA